MSAPNAAERRHLSRVAELGCIACELAGFPDTPAEIHHLRAGNGLGERSGHDRAIALCPAHHRGTQHPQVPSIHLARRAFIAQFGTEEELLEIVRRKLERHA